MRRGALVLALVAACVAVACALAPRAALAQSCPPGTWFGPSITYFTGQGPHAACLADFDGDGILDLATVSGAVLPPGEENKVTVRLGRGNGGVGNGRFGAPRHFPAGLRPYHAVAADFDQDGTLDLAVANNANAKVSILRGLGGGMFDTPVAYTVGAGPFHLAAGDLDEDEIVDLVVVNNGASSVSTLIGVGDGTFAVPGPYNVLGANPAAVEIGDFNHDSIPDLAVALYGGEVAVLRGNGGGGYVTAQKYFVGSGTFGLAQADLTGDGLPDLVTGNNGGNVSVLVGQEIPGNDAAMFTGLRTYPAGSNPALVALADFDEDGRLDVVTTNANVDSLTILLRQGGTGIGAGSFGAPSRYPMVDFPLGLAVGDLNEDDHADVVVTGWLSHDVRVWLGRCVIAPQPAPEPGLAQPYDVPADEGGYIRLSWIASDYDANVTQTVTSYRVWRRLPPGLFPAPEPGPGGGAAADALDALDGPAARSGTITRTDGAAITFWEAIATLPAQGLPTYAYDAPTARDSLAGDNPYTAFFITAATASPDVFYDSKPESAYSVDNLAPPVPSSLEVIDVGDHVALRWGTSAAPDRAGYRIYRGAFAGFVATPANRIATTTDTTYVDFDSVATASCYRVSAVDVHGNESASASVCAPTTVGVPTAPPMLRLVARSPSFGRALLVTYTLATDSPARLEAFDATGRRVFSSVETGAGERRKDLGAVRRLAAGVYVVRLTQEGTTRTAKAVLLP